MSIILQIWDNFYVISLQVLTRKKQNTTRLYQDSRPPTPLIFTPEVSEAAVRRRFSISVFLKTS